MRELRRYLNRQRYGRDSLNLEVWGVKGGIVEV